MDKAQAMWKKMTPKTDDERIAAIKRIIKEAGDIPEGLLYEIARGAKDFTKVIKGSGRKLTRQWL